MAWSPVRPWNTEQSTEEGMQITSTFHKFLSSPRYPQEWAERHCCLQLPQWICLSLAGTAAWGQRGASRKMVTISRLAPPKSCPPSWCLAQKQRAQSHPGVQQLILRHASEPGRSKVTTQADDCTCHRLGYVTGKKLLWHWGGYGHNLPGILSTLCATSTVHLN